MTIGSWKELAQGFDAALEHLPGALAAEGFGVITQIDLQQTFKQKLGIDYQRYRIIGACNPTLARQALGRDPSVGLLLPCNLVLYERPDGKAMLGAVDPLATLGAQPGLDLHDLAETVRGKLEHVLAAM